MRSAAICSLLVLLLAMTPLKSQMPAEANGPPSGLQIVIVEGEAVIHNLHRPVISQVVLRVESESKPAAGATLALTFPAEGASGTFANHAITTTVMSDAQGTAVIRGLRPNNLAGKFEIRVTASYRGQTARVTITQFNMAGPSVARKSGREKIIIILAAVGAAAAGGAYAGLHKNTSSSGSAVPVSVPSVSITAGTGAVGAP